MAAPITKAGRYQIQGELGRGSMGVVYRAYDPVIGRHVAIKTMLTEGLSPADFQEYKARFQREAQAAGMLTHPNIVTVYDFGEDQGFVYLAMEILEGKSLDALMQEQVVLPIDTIVPIFEQVCSALDHAHSRNIVHRDIKPANIMLLSSNIVKVTDFGIAKVMTMGMTQAGQILGTPNYMSPEQVKGRQVDGRSDIFSLGVILYELVTGEKPFGGQNITTVIYKIINENPTPPRELDSSIHPGLSYVISKALAKNVDERYQNCRALASDLKNYRSIPLGEVPSATVVVKGSPAVAGRRPARAAAEKVGEQFLGPPPPAPVARPPVPVVPVPAVAKGRPSAALWLLLVVLVLSGFGGGYFLFQKIFAPPSDTSSSAGNLTTGPPPAGQVASTTTQPTEPAVATSNVDLTGPTASPPEARPDTTSPPSHPVATTLTEPRPTGTTRPALPPVKPTVPQIGRLTVTANVVGARIAIDGRSQPDWLTPYTLGDLSVGPHELMIAKDGYETVRTRVQIEADKTSTYTGDLVALGGQINIITTPPGLEVLIDGRSHGTSPVNVMVPVGQHTYTIKRAGGPPYESSFVMKQGAIITRRVDMGTSGPPMGTVEVRTTPPGANIYVDGKPLGNTTPASFQVLAGRHTIIISLSGYRPVRKEIDVPAQGTVPVEETLSR